MQALRRVHVVWPGESELMGPKCPGDVAALIAEETGPLYRKH